jgi:polyphosphate kinase 2
LRIGGSGVSHGERHPAGQGGCTKERKAMAKKSKKHGGLNYDRELVHLQTELAHLQDWVRATGAKIVVVFEGRDAAGKGGIIKRLTERVSPRVFRVVALPAPTDREKTELYVQRYIAHLPAAGEVVIFDRSWYNRAGVERVMGFCTEEEADRFLDQVPRFEAMLVESGITLIKYFLSVGQEEQERLIRKRMDDPRRHWKLSDIDIQSYRRWWDYSRAYDRMIRMTDTAYAPWWIVPSDDKEQARLDCISHFLATIPYQHIPYDPPKLGHREKKPADFVEDTSGWRTVPRRT